MTERVRLAQILYSGLGGHGDVAFGIIEHDHSNRFEHVLGFLGVEPLLPAYADECRERRIHCTAIQAMAGKPWRGWLPLHRWLRQARPHAILLHSPSALLPCFLYAKRHRIPLIVAEHQSPPLRRRRDWSFTRLSFVLADRIALMTQQVAEAVRARTGRFYRPAKVAIIPNGVDRARFKGDGSTLTGRRMVRLGMTGRFVPGKRFDLAVATLEALDALRPNIEWHLELVGDGPGRAEIERLKRASPARDRLALPGSVDRLALPDVMRRFDIYLHITAGETLSMSILQAMALGLPIVASDVAGVNAVLDQRTAELVPSEDPTDFARAILGLLDQPALAAEKAEKAQRLCAERYSAAAMSDAYRALVLAEVAKMGRRD